MHPCNHWLRELRKSDHHPATDIEQALLPALVLFVSAHFLEVMTRAEALSRGGQNHNPYRGGAGNGIELVLERGDHLVRQVIESLGTVQGEGCDSGLDCREDKRLCGYQSSLSGHIRHIV